VAITARLERKREDLGAPSGGRQKRSFWVGAEVATRTAYGTQPQPGIPASHGSQTRYEATVWPLRVPAKRTSLGNTPERVKKNEPS
jgi:hypothetical protein